jgi:major membrane immunogen (membrane-anchored lipoprotein)
MSTDIISKKNIYVGSFENNNKMVVSDPSYQFNEEKYKHDSWNLYALISNAKKGKWNAWIYQYEYIKGGKRNAILYAIHSSKLAENDNPNKIDKAKWKKNMEIGVDTGQIAICDMDHYRNDTDTKNKKLASYIEPSDLKDPGEKWYSMVCAITYNTNPLEAGTRDENTARQCFHSRARKK